MARPEKGHPKKKPLSGEWGISTRASKTDGGWWWLKGWVPHHASHPVAPMVDNLMTIIIFGFLGWLIQVISYKSNRSHLYVELMAYMIAFAVYVKLCKLAFLEIGRKVITFKNLKQPRNLRKFSEQSWQLVVHTVMTVVAWRVQNRDDWKWFTEPLAKGKNDVWEKIDQGEVDPLVNSIYLFQLSVWIVTAVLHRFYDARHKDYFVMYSHHVATVMLIGGSYCLGTLRIGFLIMFLHDITDIFVDSLKMCNYAGVDSNSGLYITEVVFVLLMGTWAYGRLYIYPTVCVWPAWKSIYEFASGYNLLYMKLLFLCICLTFLLALHIWWYYLFARILYRLANAENAHAAGRDEYEGSSASEAEDEEEKPEAKKND